MIILQVSLPRRQFLAQAAGGGTWKVLQKSIGIVAMHMQLLHNDRVVIFDRTDFGKSNLSLPNGKCRKDPNELVLKTDCTAHSVEYNVLKNTYRALMVQTNVWCSSGAAMSDGRLVQTGGYNDGEKKIRTFIPCDDGKCDWDEKDGLKARRWYATNHILPDGRQIIIGGRNTFNYEFYPKVTAPNTYSLSFLVQTNDAKVENNLYPFVFLHPSGDLFIFANNRAILLNYASDKVTKTYPTMPGGYPRSYPSTGSAVLLPLRNIQSSSVEAEVLICGGAPNGSYTSATNSKFVKALDTCGRIKITDKNPKWVMETMPGPRVMGDMTLLPNGDVLIINGAKSGTAGWELGRDPAYSPFLYHPNNKLGSRFETLNPTTIPRMYHSTAILLSDGRVLVGGSNPHIAYEFSGVMFPTELRLEAFSPPYLDQQYGNLRPKIVLPASQVNVAFGQKLKVRFIVTGTLNKNSVVVTMVAPPFTTHSFSMSQRLLVLGTSTPINLKKESKYEVEVTTPPKGNLAPAGYYQLFVVHQNIPSTSIWVKLN
ncbi:hypothetical protein ACFE04_012148 [Oxalis oulophora]